MADVICSGELLIDFMCVDHNSSLINGVNFIKKPGGAAANVAACIALLGGKVAFAGKVGSDSFGRELKQLLGETCHVNVSNCLLDARYPTTLAFVALEGPGIPDFEFFHGADKEFLPSEVDWDLFDKASIAHFGGAFALLDVPFRETYNQMLKHALDTAKLISFDPNYRSFLWKNKEDVFRSRCWEFIKHSYFVKLSTDELKMVTQLDDIASGVQAIHKAGAKLVAVTLGKDGAYLSSGGQTKIVPSHPNINVVNTTGAGDSFIGAFLYRLTQHDVHKMSFEDLVEVTKFANKVAGIVCTKHGAIEALPNMDEVNKF